MLLPPRKLVCTTDIGLHRDWFCDDAGVAVLVFMLLPPVKLVCGETYVMVQLP